MQIMLLLPKTTQKKTARHQIRYNNPSADGLETPVMMVKRSVVAKTAKN
jgi:hypothetical protein